MGIAHRTTVFIPSHNEEDSLPTTLTSLLNRGFGRIVVVSDNSTDGTVQVARSFGVDVFETVGNTDKKAGALNQALSHYLPQMDESDFAFCIDADTSLGEDFMTVAQSTFEDDPALVAIGGVFRGEAPTNPLELAQFNEYARYGREVERTKRTMVLSGTSSLMKVWILREVAKARDPILGIFSEDKNISNFWKKVNKEGPVVQEGLTPCWEYQGRKQADGYGELDENRKGKPQRYWLAHRYAYTVIHGEIPKGAYILHHCDNRSCVNPEHLYPGDQFDNMKDRKDRGGLASRRGEGNTNARLTWDDIHTIRSSYTGEHGHAAKLAREYGITDSQMSSILKNKSWREGDSAVSPKYYDPKALTED